MKKYVAAILILLCLGCQPRVNSGTIISKEFIPSHNESNILILPNRTIIPHNRRIPDRWIFTVQDGSGRTQRTAVTEHRYNQYQVGDFYRVP